MTWRRSDDEIWPETAAYLGTKRVPGAILGRGYDAIFLLVPCTARCDDIPSLVPAAQVCDGAIAEGGRMLVLSTRPEPPLVLFASFL